jgi:hypothetical protein
MLEYEDANGRGQSAYAILAFSGGHQAPLAVDILNQLRDAHAAECGNNAEAIPNVAFDRYAGAAATAKVDGMQVLALQSHGKRLH